MKRFSSKRSAFTLVELLVVMGILSILTGLSLVAVQAIREQARATSCQNNLRQVNLGFASFEATHGHLPYGMPISYSIFVQILPFVEHQNLYHSIDFKKFPGEPENLDIVRKAPSFLHCPSNTGPDAQSLPQFESRTCYLASWGTPWLLGEDNGVFSKYRLNPETGESIETVPTLARIHDGLSNTVALAEFAFGTRSNRLRVLEVDPNLLTVSRFDQLLEEAPATTMNGQIGERWYGLGIISTYYNHYVSPGGKSARSGTNHHYGTYTPSSDHPGRIHVSRADGSVTTIPYSIDRVVWVQLGHRNDGGTNPFDGVR